MKQMRRFMNFRAVTTSIAVGVISAIALSGCSSTDETRPIRLAGIPLEDTQNVADSYAILMEIISDATGREVEFYQSPDYTSGTEALLAGQVDIAQISSFSYVMATSRSESIAILGVSTRDPNNVPGYLSYGIKQSGDPEINSLEDLKGKKVCFSDPSSGAGYMWPAKFLAEAGLDPDPVSTQDFEPIFADTFPQVALSVSLGDCDAGFILDAFFDKTLVNSELVDLGTIEKFWTSTPSPNIPLVANSDLLSLDEINLIQKGLEAKANKPYLVEAGICDDFATCSLLTAAAWGYVPAEDELYDELRDLCALLRLDQCK